MINSSDPVKDLHFNVNAKEFVPKTSNVLTETVDSQSNFSFEKLLCIKEFVPRSAPKYSDGELSSTCNLECDEASELVSESVKTETSETVVITNQKTEVTTPRYEEKVIDKCELIHINSKSNFINNEKPYSETHNTENVIENFNQPETKFTESSNHEDTQIKLNTNLELMLNLDEKSSKSNETTGITKVASENNGKIISNGIDENQLEIRSIKNESTNSEKFFIGIDPPFSTIFNLKSKLFEDRGKVIVLIEEHTQCFLKLRGKGSGYIDKSGLESNEPLHILVEYKNDDFREKIKHLLKLLITDLHTEFQKAFKDYQWACKNPCNPTLNVDNSTGNIDLQAKKKGTFPDQRYPNALSNPLVTIISPVTNSTKWPVFHDSRSQRLRFIEPRPNLIMPYMVRPMTPDFFLYKGVRLFPPPYYRSCNFYSNVNSVPVSPFHMNYRGSSSVIYPSPYCTPNSSIAVDRSSIPLPVVSQNIVNDINPNLEVEELRTEYVCLNSSTINKVNSGDNLISSVNSSKSSAVFSTVEELNLNRDPVEDAEMVSVLDLPDKSSRHFTPEEKMNERRKVDAIFSNLVRNSGFKISTDVTALCQSKLNCDEEVENSVEILNQVPLLDKSPKLTKLNSLKQFVKQFYVESN